MCGKDNRESEDINKNKETKELIQKQEKRGGMSFVRILLSTLFIVIAILIMHGDVIKIFHVTSSSMETTLLTDDKVIGNLFVYKFSEPKRGDVIVFRFPLDENKRYIKRVVGLPGETVEIKNGQVFIDGVLLEEDYIHDAWGENDDDMVFSVPEGSYFVMGDNRDNSIDSRYWVSMAEARGLADNEKDLQQFAFVKKEKIIAKAVFRISNNFGFLG